jgi:phosphoribosylglycinamide formyltransferase 1
MIRLALFASGTGTNALNLLRKARLQERVSVICLVVDTDTKLTEQVEKDFPEVHTHRILRSGLTKAQHEENILGVLHDHKVDYVLLCGYMRILGPTLLSAYKNKIINIHPSLLPLYPGVDSYARAFRDKVCESGVTIHLVDEGVDTGPVLLQKSFPRLETDSLEDFVNRGKALEWELYPQVFTMLGV